MQMETKKIAVVLLIAVKTKDLKQRLKRIADELHHTMKDCESTLIVAAYGGTQKQRMRLCEISMKVMASEKLPFIQIPVETESYDKAMCEGFEKARQYGNDIVACIGDVRFKPGSLNKLVATLIKSRNKHGLPILAGSTCKPYIKPYVKDDTSKKHDFKIREKLTAAYQKPLESPFVSGRFFALYMKDMPVLPNNKNIAADIWLNCYFFTQSNKLKSKPDGYSPLLKVESAIAYFELPYKLDEWVSEKLHRGVSAAHAMEDFPQEYNNLCRYFSRGLALNKSRQTPLPKRISLKQWIHARWVRKQLRLIELEARAIIADNKERNRDLLNQQIENKIERLIN